MIALALVLAAVAPAPAQAAARCSSDPCRDRRTERRKWVRRYDRLSPRARRWARTVSYCESRRDRHAHSPGYRYHSYFQWSPPTWRAAGGPGHPETRAGYHQQAVRAVRFARRYSVQHWPVCGYRAPAP